MNSEPTSPIRIRALALSEQEVQARVAARVHEPAVLDHVIAQLREIDRQTGLERTLAIGELILRQFFGGDPSTWRDRRRNKNNSIRRLAARAECPFAKSALNDAVGVYVAVMASPCVRTFGHVGASHVRVVLNLDIAERERMLGEAEHSRWSVREFRQNMVSMRRAKGERRGRTMASEEARLLRGVRENVRGLGAVLAELQGAASISPWMRAELHALVEQGVRKWADIRALAGLMAGMDVDYTAREATIALSPKPVRRMASARQGP